MGLSFLSGMIMIFPLPMDVAKGLIPSVPAVEGGNMMVAAFVGTTMAAATFLSRPFFIKGNGWDKNDIFMQKRDRIISAMLIFLISAAIMAMSCGALFYNGNPIEKVADMPTVLTPIAGKLAMVIFFSGTLCAGLSSIFPILLIVPLLLADYKSGILDTKSQKFKILTAIAALVGLTIPIFGSNPIEWQILSQVFNIFVLPLVIVGIMFLINSKHFRKVSTTPLWINLSLLAALFFALVISYSGITGIYDILY